MTDLAPTLKRLMRRRCKPAGPNHSARHKAAVNSMTNYQRNQFARSGYSQKSDAFLAADLRARTTILPPSTAA